MGKIDLKKAMKDFYAPSSEIISVIDVPALNFLMIDGHGDPNVSAEYRSAVEALYSAAYTIKFKVKNIEKGIDFIVMPLEGLWWTPTMEDFSTDRKSDWLWRMMILQPEFVTERIFREAVDTVRTKKGTAAIDRLSFGTMTEGRCAQIMYHGPYSGEVPTIARLHRFIAEKGYRLSGTHHEIYLNDPRRTAPERLRTIIRQPMIVI